MSLQHGMVLDLETSEAHASLSKWFDALAREQRGVNMTHSRQSPLEAIALNATHDATLATLRQAIDENGKYQRSH